MNRKGQALIEFILILPVFLMILFIIIDFAVIFNAKNNLESDSNTIIELIKNGKSVDEILQLYKKEDNNFNITLVKEDDNYTKVILEDYVDLITPGLNRVLEDPYPIKLERVIYYENS